MPLGLGLLAVVVQHSTEEGRMVTSDINKDNSCLKLVVVLEESQKGVWR